MHELISTFKKKVQAGIDSSNPPPPPRMDECESSEHFCLLVRTEQCVCSDFTIVILVWAVIGLKI